MADFKDVIDGFPDDFAPLDVKTSEEYILRYFNAIWSVNKNNFYGQSEQRGIYMLNRKFAEGLQDIEEMKQFLKVDGDLSNLNLDWHPINRIATIVDNMVGMITDKIYKIKVTPSDTVSKQKYDDERNKLMAESELIAIDKQNNISGRTGIPLVPKGAEPMDDEEIDLHLRMNFKTDDALAMELALRWVYDSNNFDRESIPELVRDIIVDKKTCIKHYYDKNRNLRTHRFDHIDVLTPYSKDPRFKKINYQMFLNQFTIGQIATMNTDLTEEDLYQIAKQYAGKNLNPLWDSSWSTSYEGYYNTTTFSGVRPWQNFMITVGEGYFLTPVTETTKLIKHKNSKTSKSAISRDTETGADFKVVDSAKNTKIYRIEGMWIPGSNYLWSYGLSKNVERDVVYGGYSPECELPGVIIAPNIYDMQNKSIVERCIPFEKQINLSYLKLQQFKIMASPPGYAIDERGLDVADAPGQGGGRQKHTEKFKQLRQTGSFTYYGWDIMNGQLINIPFKELKGGMQGGEEGFINDINMNVDLINKVVGFNTAVDASSPDKEAAVGTSQMAQQATYNCMKPVISAVIDVMDRNAKRVALMIQDSINTNNPAFVDAIGKSCADVLTLGRKMAFSTENIQICAMPDAEEQAQLMNLISLGIQSNPPLLYPSDVLRIEQQMKSDVTLAGQLLVQLEAKNQKAQQDAKNQDMKNNAMVQQQSTMAASAAKIQEMNAQAKIDSDKMQEEYKLKGELQKLIDDDNYKLQQLKNEGADTVAEIAAGGKVNVQDAANKGKVVASQIESNTQIAKEKIKHHTTHTVEDRKHQNEMELADKNHENNLEELAATPKPVVKSK